MNGLIFKETSAKANTNVTELFMTLGWERLLIFVRETIYWILMLCSFPSAQAVAKGLSDTKADSQVDLEPNRPVKVRSAKQQPPPANDSCC